MAAIITVYMLHYSSVWGYDTEKKCASHVIICIQNFGQKTWREETTW